MLGTIYGVDVKLHGKHSIPIGIEINGVDFGTDFFKYPEGLGYYRKFAEVVGEHSRGPLFIEGGSEPLGDVEQRTTAIKQRLARLRAYYRNLAEPLSGHFKYDASWLGDLEAFELGQLTKLPEHEELFYQRGGREAGVEVYVFADMKSRGNNFVFELHNGRRLKIAKKSVGAIWPDSETIYSSGPEERQFFLNSEFIETALEYKPLFKFLLKMALSEKIIGKYQPFPPSVIYGLGHTKATELVRSLERAKKRGFDLVVKKRGGGHCGTGVQIMATDDALEEARGWDDEELPDKLIPKVLCMMRLEKLEHLLTVYEPFMSSKPIHSEVTGQDHDGCARIVVYRPPGGDPIVIDGQWRLCPLPMDADGDLNLKYRANLSRGAFAEPISERDKEILFPFSEFLIEKFEKAAIGLEGHLANTVLKGKDCSNAERLRFLFWYISLHEGNFPDSDPKAYSELIHRGLQEIS